VSGGKPIPDPRESQDSNPGQFTPKPQGQGWETEVGRSQNMTGAKKKEFRAGRWRVRVPGNCFKNC
jgi:hypothetical protein